ncbi:MAG: hypothetical protein AAF713_05735 [Pseudomonadota bacterium]
MKISALAVLLAPFVWTSEPLVEKQRGNIKDFEIRRVMPDQIWIERLHAGICAPMAAVQTSKGAASFGSLSRTEGVRDGAGAARAALSDANDFPCFAKAYQLCFVGHRYGLSEGRSAIGDPVSFIHTHEAPVFPGDAMRATASIINSDGAPVQVGEIDRTRCHLSRVFSMSQAGAANKTFLEG